MPGPVSESVDEIHERQARDLGWYKCVGGEFTKIESGLQYVAADAEEALDIERWLAEKRSAGTL